MSVLTFLYPRNLDALAIEQLLPIARKKIEHIAIAELELRKNATPDWESLAFVHSAEPTATFLFMVARNTKENIDDREQWYADSTDFPVVRSARKYVWAQHKAPLELPLKRLNRSWATFTELIAVVADVSNAVIDSPENEKLFTPSAFRRHHRKHSKGQPT